MNYPIIRCTHKKRVKLTELKPHPKNPNTHPKDQINLLAKIITHQGWRSPIVVSERSGFIVAGHGRYEAAKLLGLKDAPVDVQEFDSDADELAHLIADNQIAELSELSKPMLQSVLTELQAMKIDMDMTGFLDDEIRGVFGTSKIIEDEVPEPPVIPITKPGDLWILGDHRLLCGDSTKADDVERLMGGIKADLFLTDPPYNVDYVGKTKAQLTVENDSMGDSEFRLFLQTCFKNAFNSMKSGASFYIWHADLEGYNFRGAVFDCGQKVRQCLIWLKNTLVMGRQDYQWKHEPCLYGWKEGDSHNWYNDRKQTTILEFDRPTSSQEHPTMKPVALFSYQIMNNTPKGAIVYDAFLGSGTTLIAAEQLGRKCFGLEISPQYCDVIVKRWENLTGKKSVMDN